MTRTFDPSVERDASIWTLVAAVILGMQGLSKLFYATFLPAPLTGAGIDLPVVGTMPNAWIVVGTIALVSAVGIAAGRSWSRYLGSVSAVIAIVAGVLNAQDATMSLIAFILPGVVLFALWRKWPTTDSA